LFFSNEGNGFEGRGKSAIIAATHRDRFRKVLVVPAWVK
jgi:hypothetical protein